MDTALLQEINKNLLIIINQNNKLIEANEKLYRLFSQYDSSYHEEMEKGGLVEIPR